MKHSPPWSQVFDGLLLLRQLVLTPGSNGPTTESNSNCRLLLPLIWPRDFNLVEGSLPLGAQLGQTCFLKSNFTREALNSQKQSCCMLAFNKSKKRSTLHSHPNWTVVFCLGCKAGVRLNARTACVKRHGLKTGKCALAKDFLRLPTSTIANASAGSTWATTIPSKALACSSSFRSSATSLARACSSSSILIVRRNSRTTQGFRERNVGLEPPRGKFTSWAHSPLGFPSFPLNDIKRLAHHWSGDLHGLCKKISGIKQRLSV